MSVPCVSSTHDANPRRMARVFATNPLHGELAAQPLGRPCPLSRDAATASTDKCSGPYRGGKDRAVGDERLEGTLHVRGRPSPLQSCLLLVLPFKQGKQLFNRRKRGLSVTLAYPTLALRTRFRSFTRPHIFLSPPILHSFIFYFLFSLVSLIADGPHHYHPACGHKGSSHLSPVHALQFFIAMQVQHSYNSSTNGRILLTHVPTLSVTRKKEHKSYFGKNRTHDFRTSRCAGYLLDHSGNDVLIYINIYTSIIYSRYVCTTIDSTRQLHCGRE